MIKINNKELQMILVTLLDEIHNICVSNNISYFIMYGTLLGAVRHNGFIPWDDDIDIVMDRSNYNMFLSIINQNLPSLRYIQNTQTDNEFEIPITRYCIINSFCNDLARSRLKSKKFIYLDILPLDNVPDNPILSEKQIKKVMKYRKLIYYKMHYNYKHRTLFGYLRDTMYAYLLKLISLNYLVKKLDMYMQMYNNIESSRVINFNTAYNIEKDTFNINLFANKKLFSFENRKYYGPIDFDVILKQLYNNYYELPPIEKRIIRHECYIDKEYYNLYVK